jgi:hypothetical protein
MHGSQVEMTSERLDKVLELLAKWNLVKNPKFPGKVSLTPKGKNIVNYHSKNLGKGGNTPYISITPGL